MGFTYLQNKDINASLQDFADGNIFTLFKLALSNMDDPREILDNQFILKIISNINNINKNSFIDLLIEKYIDFNAIYEEQDSVRINHYDIFWQKKKSNKSPFFLHLLPYLNDEQFSKILNKGTIHKIDEVYGKISEDLIINLFDRGFNKSIIGLKEQYFLISNLNLYDKKIFIEGENEKSLEEFLFEKVLKNPDLLKSFTKLSYYSFDSICERWLENVLSKEKIDNNLVKSFLDKNMEELTDEGKETIIAYMLYKTENLNLLFYALNKINIKSIKDYSPKKIPIWLKSGEHKNKLIYKKLLKNGINMFDYYEPTNKIFISCIAEGTQQNDVKKIIEDQNLDLRQFYQELIEEKIDINNNKFTNFSVLLTARAYYLKEILNISIEDLGYISNKYKNEKYNKMNDSKKLSIINELIEKTFLASTYCPKKMLYGKYIKEAEINFNLFAMNEYNPKRGIYLIDEHLNLLEKVKTEKDYRPLYFKFLKKLFSYYGSKYINEKTEIYNTYNKIIDYVATDSTLDWKQLTENMNTEEQKKIQIECSDGSLNLINYINKVCLSYEILQKKKIEPKKFKI